MAACYTGKISGSRQHRSRLITILERVNLILTAISGHRKVDMQRNVVRPVTRSGHKVGNNSATVGAPSNFAA